MNPENETPAAPKPKPIYLSLVFLATFKAPDGTCNEAGKCDMSKRTPLQKFQTRALLNSVGRALPPQMDNWDQLGLGTDSEVPGIFHLIGRVKTRYEFGTLNADQVAGLEDAARISINAALVPHEPVTTIFRRMQPVEEYLLTAAGIGPRNLAMMLNGQDDE